MKKQVAAWAMSFTAMGCACVVKAATVQETLLAPVTVTATPLVSETLPSIEAAQEQLKAVAGGANIVDAQQYKQGRVSTLDDALKFSPGVFIASRFGAEEARLSIRGSGLQRTFHMRGIQLLQDGVPLNLADGSADFQAVEPLSAQYAQVFRGANALQFGATTLGGAVNFVSPSGLTSPKLGARFEAGSFAYRRAQVYTGSATEKLDWFFSASQFQQDGYRDHAHQNTQRVSGNLGWQLHETLETRFFVNLVKTDSELPGALTRAEMQGNPRVANPGNISGDQKRDYDLVRLSNLTTLKFDGQSRLEVGTFYSSKSLFHPINQVLDQNSEDVGLNLRYIGEAPLAGKRNRLILGMTMQSGKLEDDHFANVGGQRGVRQAEATQHARNLTLFAENQHYFIHATALIVGLQAVNSKRRLDDAFLANGDHSVNQTYDHVSPRLGVLHELFSKVQVYANVSGSFEPPSFGELPGGANIAPVKAQKATTMEIGSRGSDKQSWGRSSWDVSLYHARVRDELLSLTDANNNPVGTVNAKRTMHQGIEAGLEALVGTSWTARVNYLLNDFRFDNHAVYRSNRLAGVPRQVAQAEVLFKLDKGIYLGPNVRAASSAYIDHANSLKAAGYAVMGFRAGQQVDKQVSWFVEGRNLADKTYAGTTGVAANANGSDGRYYFPGDGRSLYAGLELKY